jgi:hypothetical protein
VSPTAGVLREAWALYSAQWRRLLPIAFVVYVVVAVAALLLDAVLADWAAGLLAALIGIVGAYWLQGALTKAVDDVRGGRAEMSISETFAHALPRSGPIVVASILAGIGIGLGLLLLIVPGLVLMTWWALIVPVIVLENAGASESLGRSRELVRGHAWNVFGVIVVTIVLLVAASIPIALALSPLETWIRTLVAPLVGGTLVAPFVAVTWTLLYYRLREARREAV